MRPILCTTVAGLALVGSVLISAAPSQAAPSAGGLGPQRLGSRPVMPRSAADIGPLASRTALRLEVTLKVRNQAALTSFIAALSDPSSPQFGRYLTPAEFGARFGATQAQLAAVDGALRSLGLSPGTAAADRLSIPVTAPASAVERAFSTSLSRYRLKTGRVVFANSAAPLIPGAAAPYVQSVLGLDDVNIPQSLALRPVTPASPGAAPAVKPAASGPKPCSAAKSTAASFGSFTANQLANYYGMSPLYGLGDLGKGVRVALVEFEPNLPSDIAGYEKCYGIKTSVSYIKVNGGVKAGAGEGEAALDIEDVAGLAPDAAIDVYQAPNGGDTDTYDMYKAIIDADKDQVISTSWGLCELDNNATLMKNEQSLFEQAATQGQTVFAAAGDFGSTACLPDDSSNSGNLSVSDPAAQPYVDGVGGTTISGSKQTVWNNSSIDNGAGGGGLSNVWCMPKYQDQTSIPGLDNTDSEMNSGCTQTSNELVRQVPDVSADANPNTGYVIDYKGSWLPIGGTSAAAPLWAAIAALTDASPFCKYYGNAKAGVQPAGLYAGVSENTKYVYSKRPEVLYDVTSGNNDYTPSGYTGGLYPATKGYDMASGLGTPLVTGFTGAGKSSEFYPGLTALMCRLYGGKLTKTTITKISPDSGSSKSSHTVTLTGTGFLPIAGADLVLVGTAQEFASCSSTTKCTVKFPKMKAGTVTVRIVVEDFIESAVTKATHFRYVK
jgi:subtilase family serine protease